jgi:hypothetical protein
MKIKQQITFLNMLTLITVSAAFAIPPPALIDYQQNVFNQTAEKIIAVGNAINGSYD